MSDVISIYIILIRLLPIISMKKQIYFYEFALFLVLNLYNIAFNLFRCHLDIQFLLVNFTWKWLLRYEWMRGYGGDRQEVKDFWKKIINCEVFSPTIRSCSLTNSSFKEISGKFMHLEYDYMRYSLSHTWFSINSIF